MTQAIFIGVDGGATKCKVRIEDQSGNLLGQAMGGPSNIRISVEKSWETVLKTIQEALKPTTIALNDQRYVFHVGMGLAGCEVTEAYDAFVHHAHPFQTLKVSSDAHTACIGAHDGKDGAIIIIGTGVVGYQIQANQEVRVGGWGFPHDDEGGGAWLGLEAARLTFHWLDHRAEKSPLAEEVFDFFNRDLEKFVSWANHANSSEFARLAPLVINHAQQEEINAIRLMKKAAHAIERIVVALEKTRTNKKENLPMALFGGIAPFMEPFLNEEVRAHLVSRKADANVGAILMVKQQLSAGQK